MECNDKNQALSKNEIEFFYNDILLHYENDLKDDSNGYDYNNEKVRDFVKTHNIKLEYSSIVEEHTIPNRCVYTKTHRKRKTESKCVAFIHRIRNAFAHGHITKINKRTYEIRDYNKERLTMYGRINAKLLKELVELFKTTRKPQQ